MKDDIVKLTDTISRFGLLLAIVLLPVTFLPVTSEYYEFNKSVLFLGVMVVVLVSWIVNLAFTGKISFWKVSIDRWILAVLGVGSLSLFFSQHFMTSLLGYSANLSEGFLVLIALVVFSFVVRHVVSKEWVIETFMWAILASGALLGLFSVLQYFGIYILAGIEGLEFTASRSFTPLGSSLILPYFFLAVIPVGLGFLVTRGSKIKPAVAASLMLSFNVLGFVVSAGNFWSWPGMFLWGGLLVSVVFVLMSAGKLTKSSFKWLIGIAVVMVSLFAIRNFDSIGSKVITTDDEYVVQPSLQYDASWSIAAATLSQSPVNGALGSGPATFAYDFTRYRPVSYNESDNWDVRFSRSGSQLLEFMGNYGVLGLAAWGALLVFIVLWVFKINRSDYPAPYSIYIKALGISLLLMVLSSLFTFFTINLWLMFWLFIGLLVAVRALSDPRSTERINLSLSMSREKISVQEKDVLPVIMLVPSVIIFFVGIWGLSTLYRAEVYYQEARTMVEDIATDSKKSENLEEAFNNISKAIDLVNFRDSYHADYSIVAINLLKKFAQTTESADSETYQAQQQALLATATRSAEKATELNPVNVRNWEARVSVYQELIKLTNGGYISAALDAIDEAIKYDPIKPQLYHQKGVILSLNDQDSSSVDEIRKAINLQPVLLTARYDLVMQYKKMEEYDEAVSQMQLILEILENNGLGDSDVYYQALNVMNSLEEGSSSESEEDLTLPDAGEITEE